MLPMMTRKAMMRMLMVLVRGASCGVTTRNRILPAVVVGAGAGEAAAAVAAKHRQLQCNSPTSKTRNPKKQR